MIDPKENTNIMPGPYLPLPNRQHELGLKLIEIGLELLRDPYLQMLKADSESSED